MAYGNRFGLPDFEVSSAGTHALVGHPVEPTAARVLEQLGGDPSGFAARQLTPAIAADADLVLSMTTAHRDDVLKLAPHQLHRTFTLREGARLVSEGNALRIADLPEIRAQFPASGSDDIPDPIGRGEAYFAMVGAQIADLLRDVLELCRDDRGVSGADPIVS